MQVGPRNPESSLPLRTSPAWLTATPENLNTDSPLPPIQVFDPPTVPAAPRAATGRGRAYVAGRPATMVGMEWLLLGISVGLVLACGVFGAAEYCPRRRRPRCGGEGRQRGRPTGQGVRRALSSLSTQLSGAQIGVTLTNLVIGFLAEPAIAIAARGPADCASEFPRVPSRASPSRSGWCSRPSRR